MCGRYSLFLGEEAKELQQIIREVNERSQNSVKTGEIFPTNLAPILKADGNAIRGDAAIWGFPNFARKGVIINARAETALEKKMFRTNLLERRCLIPTTGFYEWSQDETHQKYSFTLPGSAVVYLAGFYGEFAGEQRYVILTTSANPSVQEIHHRMPVILTPPALGRWLEDTDFAVEYLEKPMPELERNAV